MKLLDFVFRQNAKTFSVGILLIGAIFWAFGWSKPHDAYPRTQFWVDSANCAKKTGHFLIVCENAGGERPIEDISLADDRGHVLILSAVSIILNIDPSLDVLRLVNVAINLIGFLLLTIVLQLRVGWRSGAIAALIGAYWLGARAGPDVDAAYIGIAAMSAAAMILAAGRVSVTTAIGVLLLLSATSIIRQPVGFGASISLILLAITSFYLVRSTTLRRYSTLAALLLIATFSIMAPSMPTAIRNAVLHTKPTGIAAHGLSHNLFLGLGGYVDNKWKIVWDDTYAQNLMKQLHPEIAYCSDAYFKEIGKLYWRYVRDDPAEAARIYLVKAGRTFAAAEGLSVSALFSLVNILGLLMFAKRKSRWPAPVRSMLLLGPVLFALSFLAQGVLTHPAWTYIYPGPILLMICVAIAFDISLKEKELAPPS
ncbi:hypothetical protein BH10BDE1_BH10BDE1_34560 [soil metagenome]